MDISGGLPAIQGHSTLSWCFCLANETRVHTYRSVPMNSASWSHLISALPLRVGGARAQLHDIPRATITHRLRVVDGTCTRRCRGVNMTTGTRSLPQDPSSFTATLFSTTRLPTESVFMLTFVN
jgi:hypothetical protein